MKKKADVEMSFILGQKWRRHQRQSPDNSRLRRYLFVLEFRPLHIQPKADKGEVNIDIRNRLFVPKRKRVEG